MSKFTATPYIETVLSEVSGENKAILANFINGKSADGTGTISYTLVEDAAGFANLSSGITPVNFKFSPTITWTGYFIKTTSYSTFITFKTAIDLWLATVYKLEDNSLVPVEKVTADNIRTLLREDAYIDPTEINSYFQIKEVNSLPLTGEENTIYLTNTNAQSEGGVVRFPVPTAADAGKVFGIDAEGNVELSNVIAQLKAGTLPVYDKDVTIYELTENENKDNFGMFYYDGVLILFYVEGLTGSNVYMYVFNMSNAIEYCTFTYTVTTDITLQDCYDNAENSSYIGTKLYRHRITGFTLQDSGVTLTVSITIVNNQKEKITNAGMLSMLTNSVSNNIDAIYNGSSKLCVFKNFISGPNIIYVYLLEGVSQLSEGTYSLTIGTIRDTVTEL